MLTLLKKPSMRRFLRYTAAGTSTLALDLLFIWVMTEYVGVPYYVSTAIGFLLAISLNYFISRRFVFKGTERKVHHGYLYFLMVAGVGATVVTGVVALMVATFGMHYLLARFLVASFVGMGNYLFNLHLNFKVAGRHT